MNGTVAGRMVDLPLKVLFYRGRAENRTFRPPETNKQKKTNFKFKMALKIGLNMFKIDLN